MYESYHTTTDYRIYSENYFMKNLFVFIIIFLGLLALYFYTHLYIAKFISQASFIKNKILFKKIFVFLSVFPLFVLILRTKFNNSIFLEYVYILGLSWMGCVIILTNFCILGSLLLVFKKINKNIVVSSVIILSLFSIFYSFYISNILPTVKKINIDYKNFVAKDKKLKILFIADTHFDFRYKNKLAPKFFQKIVQLEPAFLIIGGDFLDPGFILDEYILKIKDFKFKKIAVFGNHEYYFSLDKSKKIFETLGFYVLKNDSITIDKINFIGLGDIRTENLSKKEVLEIINKNYKVGYLNIVISHQPLYFKEISDKFDVIMVSGHTHKGQIFPFHIFTKFFYRYFYGLYKNKNSYLYVTSGAGVWGPPMRFLSNPEIMQIILN